ncbi:MAG: CoA pyrophosphatase [Deltaproteobacteria bacterium]|nr:CoA pyrophosphatase [Deltaproteobacteria bacterium]
MSAHVSAQLGDLSQRLGARPRGEIALEGFSPAAVTLPLVATPEGLAVLFTVRTAHVEQHKGEISFPGGRVDPNDEDTLATALREAREEVGVQPEDVAVLGVLDDFVSITGYRVTPHVVWLDRHDYPFEAEPREVAEILLVPLSHLLDPLHHHIEELPGHARPLHFFRWGPYVIWGLTAAILHRFLGIAFGFGEHP